jgi:hypothetical protein
LVKVVWIPVEARPVVKSTAPKAAPAPAASPVGMPSNPQNFGDFPS